MRTLSLAALAGGLLLCTSAAQAHITFENREAAAGSTVKLVLRVPHGCDGSATTRVRIQLPLALKGAKPQPKPGWTLETTPRASESAAGGHAGHDAGAELGEIAWVGGPLPDAWYDEFVVRASVDAKAPAGPLYIPIVQECEKGVDRWIELPANGKSADELAKPAPSIRIVPRP